MDLVCNNIGAVLCKKIFVVWTMKVQQHSLTLLIKLLKQKTCKFLDNLYSKTPLLFNKTLTITSIPILLMNKSNMKQTIIIMQLIILLLLLMLVGISQHKILVSRIFKGCQADQTLFVIKQQVGKLIIIFRGKIIVYIVISKLILIIIS